MYAGDFFFKPSEIHLEAGKSYKLVVSNQGEVDHEVEFLGLGEEIEQVVPWKGQTAVLLAPRHGGRYPFICDMPGHLSKGMQGSLVVH
ncbi:MAG: cupredoxin domain-containing protein [Deltaproteobacteria bacterium]|nr:cupredoxin domain-containing protein [Deltaproteobacteria bacterium]